MASKTPIPPREKPTEWLPLILILTVTALLYAPTLRFGFVYDDVVQILTNPRIHSWQYLGSYFAHHVWLQTSQTGSYYRPLFLVWLRLNYAVFGTNALGWHLTTVLVHLIAVGAAYLVLQRTVRNTLLIACAVGIFALHPTHIESVAWISGVTDPLMAIPLFASLLFWLRYRESRNIHELTAAGTLFIFALLVKESAAMLPFLVFFYAAGLDDSQGFFNRLRRSIYHALPFAVALALYWTARVRILGHELSPPLRPFSEAFFNLPALTAFYTHHLFWPARLSVMYDFALTHSSGAFAAGFAIIVLAVAVATLLLVRDAKNLVFAYAWIVVPVAIAIAGITTFDPHDYVHDRYLYLPALGLGLLIGQIAMIVPATSAKVFGQPATHILLLTAILIALAAGTESQLAPWANNMSLFTHAVEHAPANPLAYEHLAFEIYRHGDIEEAINLYKKSVALDPADWRANFGLAVMDFRSERWQEADIYCGRANQISPDSNNVCYQYQTIALMNLGRWAEAEIPVRKAIAIWPGELNQHLMLGQILAHQGRKQEAKTEFDQELRLNPASKAAHVELEKLLP